MDLADFDSKGGEWLRAEGPEADVVMSSRVRLARNLAGFPFATKATDEQKAEIVGRVRAASESLPLGRRHHFVEFASAGSAADRRDVKEREIDRGLLHERHLISSELEKGRGPRGVAFGSDERSSVMVNEEDHLRLQAIRTGLDLHVALDDARALDASLEAVVPYAVSAEYGYLTACPTNVGTGMRASVMLHLPSLVSAQEMNRVFQAASRTGLTVRGFYGEGTKAMGDFYQISNQVTLGQSEDDILEKLSRMLPTFLEYERRVREHLATSSRVKLEDKVHRALALLQAARSVSTDEAMENLSSVRLGVVVGLLTKWRLPEIHELFVLVQPYHLRRLNGRGLELPAERDVARANLLRERLLAGA